MKSEILQCQGGTRPAKYPRGKRARRPHQHVCDKCGKKWNCEPDQYKYCTASRNVEVCGFCAFSLTCRTCDAGSNVDSIGAALGQGWIELTHEVDGMFWTWIGFCPECLIEAENEPEPVVEDAAGQE